MGVAMIEVVDTDQHIYTRREVEHLLWTHLSLRPQLTTHGRTVARYGAGPYVCPRCLGDPERRKGCVFCERTGRVTDVLPAGSGTVSVPDALLGKADLLRAMRQLSERYRVLLLHFYATQDSPERIGRLLARHNGGAALSARTVYRWRSEAVDMLVTILNRTYARR